MTTTVTSSVNIEKISDEHDGDMEDCCVISALTCKMCIHLMQFYFCSFHLGQLIMLK